MKAIQLFSYGDPLDGLRYVDLPDPGAPSDNEVLIKVEFSPINVSDLLLARGMYAAKPTLPSVIGNEGSGRVLAVGKGVRSVNAGDQVLIPHGTFVWAEKVIALAKDVFVVPAGVEPQQASMLSINPPTAGLLLTEFVDLKPGDWIVQNSANSGVGRAVIAIAKSLGVNTINIVRRSELVDELKSLGGNLVAVASSSVVSEIKKEIGDVPVVLGLDGVSGAATGTLSEILTWQGKILCYAAPTREPIAVNPLTMVAKHVSVHPFYMYYPEYLAKLPEWIARSAELIAGGQLHAPVAATYPPSELTAALNHAIQGGKVLLDFTQLP